MARVKSPSAKKHRKIRKLAKGFKQARRRRAKTANESVLHAGQYAYAGRKLRKRDMRKLWIQRLNAASREHGLKYNSLISGLKRSEIKIDRKILSAIAIEDPKTFERIIKFIKNE